MGETHQAEITGGDTLILEENLLRDREIFLSVKENTPQDHGKSLLIGEILLIIEKNTHQDHGKIPLNGKILDHGMNLLKEEGVLNFAKNIHVGMSVMI